MPQGVCEYEIHEELDCEFLVVGAGVAGMAAAIQAGRLGLDTTLVEKDAVLGGNSGPNLGIHWGGAHIYHDYAAETGIVLEMEEEIAWRGAKNLTTGHHYNICRLPEGIWAEKLAEAGVRVLRQHLVRKALTEGRRVVGVLVDDLARCRSLRIRVSHAVLDASGDGQLAFDAGATYRYGREARREHGERSAPEEPDTIVAGVSMTALVRSTNHDVPFVPPRGTPTWLWKSRPSSWSPDGDCCFLWATEVGGSPDLDPLEHEHEIYERLLEQTYALWHHVKNGPFADHARHWELVWVSPKAGKRETRRFLGDAILTQTDIEMAHTSPDRVAYGGFTLDQHEPCPDGVNRIFMYSSPPLYDTCYRMTYSRDFDNLYLGGRLVSATHMAISSVRMIKTGGLLAQATAVAVWLAREHECTASEIAERHVEELQQLVLREDGSILGAFNDDPNDLAPSATVTASSECRLDELDPNGEVPLADRPMAVFYDWPERLEGLHLWVENRSKRAQPMSVTVFAGRERPQRYLPKPGPLEWVYHQHLFERGMSPRIWEPIEHFSVNVPADFRNWLAMPMDRGIALPARDRRLSYQVLGVLAEGSDDLHLMLDDRPCEIADWCRKPAEDGERVRLSPGVLGVLTLPRIPLGEATNAVNGISRRWGRGPTNLWISSPDADLPQWLELNFGDEVRMATVRLTFDTLTRKYQEQPVNNLERACGTCARRYRLQIPEGNDWRDLHVEHDNYRRYRVHRFPPLLADRLRLVIEAAHDPTAGARLYEIRVEGP